MNRYFKCIRYSLFSTLMILNLMGCHDPDVEPEKVLDTVITKYNLPNMAKLVEQRFPQLAQDKLAIVKRLAAINEGRDAYRIYLLSLGQKKEAQYLSKPKVYELIRDDMFESLDDNDITFGKLFGDLDKKKIFIESFQEKNKAFYQEIDRKNLEIQKQLDLRDRYLKPQHHALNKKVSVQLNTIEWEDDSFYIFLKLENHSDDPIRRLGYRFTLKDKQGLDIVTLSETITNMYFTGVQDSTYVVSLYDRYTGPEYYQALRYANLRGVTLDYQITKIETDKKTFPDYGEFKPFAHYENKHYQSPQKLEGKGPYTPNEQRYQLERLEAEYNKGLNASAPSLKIYQKSVGRFYDSARAFVKKFY